MIKYWATSTSVNAEIKGINPLCFPLLASSIMAIRSRMVSANKSSFDLKIKRETKGRGRLKRSLECLSITREQYNDTIPAAVKGIEKLLGNPWKNATTDETRKKANEIVFNNDVSFLSLNDSNKNLKKKKNEAEKERKKANRAVKLDTGSLSHY